MTAYAGLALATLDMPQRSSAAMEHGRLSLGIVSAALKRYRHLGTPLLVNPRTLTGA